MSDDARRYIVEVKGQNARVALRFDLNGVPGAADEFGEAHRSGEGEWIVDGVRVRVLADGCGEGAAEVPGAELLVSTPERGEIRRLRAALPTDEGADLFVGRSGRRNDVVLSDEHVSRRHVRIVLRGGRHIIEDIGSRWGTFVNGSRIGSATALVHGDEIRAGRTVLRYVKFSDGFDASAGSVHRAEPGRPSWRLDSEVGEVRTLTATTLLGESGETTEGSPGALADASGGAGEERTPRKFTNWIWKRGRSQAGR